jgi:hypothetical protein
MVGGEIPVVQSEKVAQTVAYKGKDQAMTSVNSNFLFRTPGSKEQVRPSLSESQPGITSRDIKSI